MLGLPCVTSLCASNAHADGLGFRLAGGGALALGGYQQREFGPGADLSTALEYQAARKVAVVLALDGFLLSDAADPKDHELANNNGASLAALLLGAKLGVERGLWLEAAFGCGVTGGRFRPAVTATMGYEFSSDATSGVGFGPMLKWVHLFQPDSAVRPEDANIVVAGLHIAFGGPASSASRSTTGRMERE